MDEGGRWFDIKKVLHQEFFFFQIHYSWLGLREDNWD